MHDHRLAAIVGHEQPRSVAYPPAAGEHALALLFLPESDTAEARAVERGAPSQQIADRRQQTAVAVDAFDCAFAMPRSVEQRIRQGASLHQTRGVVSPAAVGHAERNEDPFPGEGGERFAGRALHDHR